MPLFFFFLVRICRFGFFRSFVNFFDGVFRQDNIADGSTADSDLKSVSDFNGQLIRVIGFDNFCKNTAAGNNLIAFFLWRLTKLHAV